MYEWVGRAVVPVKGAKAMEKDIDGCEDESVGWSRTRAGVG